MKAMLLILVFRDAGHHTGTPSCPPAVFYGEGSGGAGWL
ncbi:hypothetical protein DESPIGER_1162 [Desulfovibrio piger]|uniref:Uncharacterized protein n=1 Tax=Desulfovibrio piger TaxID=901 RepID=A0A1K1LHR9_9BACT|nr:hypothetical protein DESPIGER_1162 [Desulfovibrio piger]